MISNRDLKLNIKDISCYFVQFNYYDNIICTIIVNDLSKELITSDDTGDVGG